MSVENKTIERRYFDEGLDEENSAHVDELLATDFAEIITAFPDRHSMIEEIIAEGSNCVSGSPDKVGDRLTVAVGMGQRK